MIFPNQLAFGIFFLKLFGNNKYCRKLKSDLSQLSENTVGKRLWHLLMAKNLELVPWYETHDLKHALLGYKMEADEEMLMQAFMTGNDFRLFNSLISLFFVIWTPEIWHKIPLHYQIGRLTRPIGNIKIEDIAQADLEQLRQQIGLYEAIKTAKSTPFTPFQFIKIVIQDFKFA